MLCRICDLRFYETVSKQKKDKKQIISSITTNLTRLFLKQNSKKPEHLRSGEELSLAILLRGE